MSAAQAPLSAPAPTTRPNQRSYVPAEPVAEFPAAWKRHKQSVQGQAGHVTDETYISWIGVNPNFLRLDLKSESESGVKEHPLYGVSAVPTVTMAVDGCRVPLPAFPLGRLGFNGPDLKLLLPRNLLPAGELTFTFAAFGNEYSMRFANDASGLRPIEPEESKFYRSYPAEPELGIEATVGIIEPNCTPDGMAEEAVQP